MWSHGGAENRALRYSAFLGEIVGGAYICNYFKGLGSKKILNEGPDRAR